MSLAPKQRPDAGLYEADFAKWAERQSAAIAGRRAAEVDWDNVAEEIASLGRAQKREIRHRLIRLYQHLLKWQFQPERRSHSWQSTISGQRLHIDGLLDMSPSLRTFPAEVSSRAYDIARREASEETGLPPEAFPDTAPWPLSEALTSGFMPGRPWRAEDLIRD